MARELTPEGLSHDGIMAAVERHMGGAFVWGVSDCTRAAGAVFADLHGLNPTAPLAGRYDGPVSAARIIRAAGGMLALGQVLADLHGLRRCDDQSGAIGLVRDHGRLVAAICIMPGHWAAKAQSGFGIVRQAEIAWCI